MPSSLHQLLISEGQALVVGGNTPFLLDDPSSVWFVESGSVEVFSVRVENGQATGTRFHFFSVRAGEALFGMDSRTHGRGRGFLAVGMVNTHLRKLPVHRLREWAENPALTSEIASLVDGWVAGLSLGVAKDVNPRTEMILEPAPEVEVRESARFRSKRGVLWIACLEGDLLFIGMEDVPFAGESVLFPISQDAWLQALGRSKVVVAETRTVLNRPGLWHGLALLSEVVFRCEAVNKRLAEVDEYNRLKDRAAAGRRAGEKALRRLATVVDEWEDQPTGAFKDPTYVACQWMGEAAGIAIHPPPELAKGQTLRDPLGAIAKASRIRLRKVSLRGKWWREEAGPLIGYLTGGKVPVTLLPTRNGQYEIRNPADSSRQLVNEEIAAKIDGFAWCFYRSFSDEALTLWQVLRFGAHGLGNDLFLYALMGAASGLLGLLPALAIGKIFGTLVPEAERTQLWQVTLGLVVAAIAIAIFDLTRAVALLRVEGKLDQSIQSAVIDRLLKLPVPFFRQFTSGELAERATGINQIRQIASATVITAVLGNAFATTNLGLLFYYSARLAGVAIGLIAIALLVTLGAGALQLRHQRQITRVQGQLAGVVLQFLTGITKLRVAGAELLAFSAWAGTFARQKQLACRSRAIGNHLQVFNAVFPLMSSAVLFWTVSLWNKTSPISTGDFLAFTSAFTAFLAPMLMMTLALSSALNIVPLFERVRPILETPPEVNLAKTDPGTLAGRVELTHVSYRYSPHLPLVLHDVSMEIRPGEFVAVVGPSGSGKSTLMRLLLGFDRPENGVVHFDSQDLAELDTTAVRRQIGVVLQSSKLMAGSILSNITGSLPLTEEDAWEAARLAGLDEDIRNFPMGMHTVVPAGGGVLSGGQQQRLMIARAIVFRPRILLFDEATSALDNRTQAIVSESLEKLQATRVVIAHRLSTIINADRIFVMENGRVVQTGTYQDLLNQPGLFSELARRQLVEDPNTEGRTFLF
ncbi:MAG TPA: NHLP bacteriocin export ABC transporter permease/ATPase subunit [Verrucomicrobiae bacterium]|nr:NHLP bacteriocin export ABC transporter permease/ATPase subunit [Verrucomicrobiae bacterium]